MAEPDFTTAPSAPDSVPGSVYAENRPPLPASSADHRPSPPLANSHRSKALAVCILAAFLTLLDVSIVTTALPSMEHNLHLSTTDVAVSISGYTLTFGLTLIPAGRLGDEFGRRRLFVIGMAAFTVTGLVCGLAPDAAVLDIGRLTRGIAAGLVAPQVVGMIQQMYPPRERGRAFGYYGATVSLSTAIGPLLGGVLIQVFGTGLGWRMDFLLFLPFSVLALVLGLVVLPRDRRIQQRRSLDLLGAGLLALAIAGLMLPLLNSGKSKGSSGPSSAGHAAASGGGGGSTHLWFFAVGALLLIAFLLRERALSRGGRQPLVELSQFRVRSYWVGTLVAAAFYGGFTGVFLVLAQYLQTGLHYSALHAALCTLTFTLGSAVCGIAAGRRAHRAPRPLVIGGSAATVLGLAATVLLIRSQPGADLGLVLAAPLLLAGCGAGCVIATNQSLALARIPRRDGSTAGGVYQTGMKLGTSVGTALATGLFFAGLTSSHGDYASAAARGLSGPVGLTFLAFATALLGLTVGLREGAFGTPSTGDR